jgi:ribosomal protein S18 acetylase RimI-like enzyme
LDIRPIGTDDLDRVCDAMPWRPRRLHASRTNRQGQGVAAYLIAWREGSPVGHALLRWGDGIRSPRAREQDCAEVEDLYVHENHRGRGAGEALLARAEDEAVARGFELIGLGVGVDGEFDAARRLYERRGYADAGYGVFEDRWRIVGDDGTVEEGGRQVRYLVKPLAG